MDHGLFLTGEDEEEEESDVAGRFLEGAGAKQPQEDDVGAFIEPFEDDDDRVALPIEVDRRWETGGAGHIFCQTYPNQCSLTSAFPRVVYWAGETGRFATGRASVSHVKKWTDAKTFRGTYCNMGIIHGLRPQTERTLGLVGRPA